MKQIGAGAVVIGLIAACGGSGGGSPGGSPPPAAVAVPAPAGEVTGPAVEQTIGAAGGTIASADGAFTVTIPPGALAADTAIKMEPIKSTVGGATGSAYRLSPEGQIFAQPVTVAARYTDENVLGSAPEALSIAYQSKDGLWHRYRRVTLDKNAKVISVPTTHFSDWSMTTGSQIRPPSATIRANESVELSVARCLPVEAGEDLTTLMGRCEPDPGTDLGGATDWAVNGTVGGGGALGTVSGRPDGATYTAPGQVPSVNPVAVSASVEALPPNRVQIVANITIVGGEEWSGAVTVDTVDPLLGGSSGDVKTTFTASLLFQTDPAFPGVPGYYAGGGNYTSRYHLNQTSPYACSTTAQKGGQIGNGPTPGASLQLVEVPGMAQYNLSVGSDGTMEGTTTCNDQQEVKPVGGIPTGSLVAYSRPFTAGANIIDDSFTQSTGAGTATIKVHLERRQPQ